MARLPLSPYALCALCAALLLSACAPMKKSGVSETPLAPASAGSAMTSFQQGDCRESIRHFTAALQQQEHPAQDDAGR